MIDTLGNQDSYAATLEMVSNLHDTYGTDRENLTDQNASRSLETIEPLEEIRTRTHTATSLYEYVPAAYGMYYLKISFEAIPTQLPESNEIFTSLPSL